MPSASPRRTPGARVLRSRTPRTLYVAATGGHLMQLVRLAARFDAVGKPLWVTFDTPQSRSLLANEDVRFVRFTGPRDVWSIILNLPTAWRLLKRESVVEMYSTGSAIALAFLPLGRIRGASCHYIESAARSAAPSATGRVLSFIPGIQMYSQYENWAHGKWKLAISVFDEFTVGARVDQTAVSIDALKVVVSLGTLTYRFDRLVNAVKNALPADSTVTWQLGPNDYGPLPGRVCSMLSAMEFAELCQHADVVIAHAGVGSALTVLEAGKCAILVARSESEGEHVDDHQSFIAGELSGRGLAIEVEPRSLSVETLAEAASRSVERRPPGTRHVANSPSKR